MREDCVGNRLGLSRCAGHNRARPGTAGRAGGSMDYDIYVGVQRSSSFRSNIGITIGFFAKKHDIFVKRVYVRWESGSPKSLLFVKRAM